MDQLPIEEAQKEFERAREALETEDFDTALAHLEKALEISDNPCWYSYVGYCIARGRGDFRTGIDLCHAAIRQERENPAHYMNLGRVYLATGNKDKAIKTLQEGMTHGGSAEILALLINLGMRNKPVFPALKRSNPLNKYLGIFLHRRAHRRRGVP